MIAYGICLSDLFHLVGQSLDPSMLLQMALFHSFLWPSLFKFFFFISSCFSPFGVLYHDTIDWVAYKEEKCIFCSSRGWEVQDQGSGRLSVKSYMLFRAQFKCYLLREVFHIN